MTQLYRIHFGFSTSKHYLQAVETAKLAHQHEVGGVGRDAWHVVSFTDAQTDLMAHFYEIADHLPPRVYGVVLASLRKYCRDGGRFGDEHLYEAHRYDEGRRNRIRSAAEALGAETGKTLQELADLLEERYWKQYQKDRVRVQKKLVEEGYFEFIEIGTEKTISPEKKPRFYLRRPKRRPRDYYSAIYRGVQELITEGEYEAALQEYYDILGEKLCGELHDELIYLKRLANIPLTGRDLICFRSESSRSQLVHSNLSEYCSCIDAVLEQYEKAGLKSPLDIIIENAPTMEELIEQTKHDWHLGVWIRDGDLKRDNTPVTIDSFSTQYDKCPGGTLFDRFPDQVQHCRIIEYPEDEAYHGLWTPFSPSEYQRQILDKGLHLERVEAYRHKLWRRRSRKRVPDFTTVASMGEIEKSGFGTNGIRYAGRSHNVEGTELYEIDLLRRNPNKPKDLGNPLLDHIEEILREAENMLREKYGLPRIGEGWVSEMQLYNLVKSVFPAAQHHASPDWLRPQHLDVFVPSENLAFEYQGSQHFEPVDFFGGEESFQRTKKLDRRKRQRCRSNGVLLIPWRYDEALTQQVLAEKLRDVPHARGDV